MASVAAGLGVAVRVGGSSSSMTKWLGSGPLAGMPRFESARARPAGRFGDSVLDTPLLAAVEGVRFMGDDVPG